MCLGLFCYESSMTLGVWPSDGQDYYEVRAVNHDTDEDYLLNGFNLTCAEVYIRRKLLRLKSCWCLMMRVKTAM